jgi:hypothetical protein
MYTLDLGAEVAGAGDLGTHRLVEGPPAAGLRCQIEVNPSPIDDAVHRRSPSTCPELNGKPITP